MNIDESSPCPIAPKEKPPSSPLHLTSNEYGTPTSAAVLLRLTEYDPPRWGWSALGGIVDLLTPHERARRKETKQDFLEAKNKAKIATSNAEQQLSKNETREKNVETITSTTEQKSTDEDDEGGKQHVLTDERPKDALHNVGKENTSYESQGMDVETTNVPEIISQKENDEVDDNAQFDKTERVFGSKSEEIRSELMENEKEPPGVLEAKDSSAMEIDETKEKINDKGDASQPVAGSPTKSASDSITEPAAESATETKTENTSKSITAANTADTNITTTTSTAMPTILEGQSADERKKKDPLHQMDSEEKAVEDSGSSLDKQFRDFNIDVLAYHRGRAGEECRDGETGELLCDMEEVDTNFNFEPNLKMKVNIRFPLCQQVDSDSGDCESKDDKNNLDKKSRKSGAKAKKTTKNRKSEYFQDTIDWDLSDPSTPCPKIFAANIAAQFGLSFGETIDLSSSIQRQIKNHLQRFVRYEPPLAAKDPFGKERPIAPRIPEPHTEEIVFGDENDSSKNNSQSKPIQPLSNTPNFMKPVERSQVMGSGRSGGKMRSINYKSDIVYRDEVHRRAMIESHDDICKIAEETDVKVGTLELRKNWVCHICHARKPIGAIFPCGLPSHSYCDYHLSNRLNFNTKDVKDNNAFLDYCPICCVTCWCPKCSRKHDAVALELEQEVLKQGLDKESVEQCELEVLCLLAGRKPSSSATHHRGRPRSVDKEGAVATPIKRKNVSSAVKREKDEEDDVDDEEDVVDDDNEEAEEDDDETLESTEKENTPVKKLTYSPTTVTKLNKKQETEEIIVIPKIPTIAFPREMCDDKDLDPSTPHDFKIVFSDPKFNEGNGNNTAYTTYGKNTASSEDEDGNINYCFKCRRGGGIICCDRCPRAFHFECLNIPGSDLSDDKWFCPHCTEDTTITPEDKITGQPSLDLIMNALKNVPYCHGFAQRLSIISKIHEMIRILLEFDFSYVFRAPVTYNECPDYREVVKNPRDLGTIACKIINGEYSPRVDPDQFDLMDKHQAAKFLDEIILEILKDVELVWHNCFLYNKEGSTCYRMAQVQQLKCYKIKSVSIDRYLDSKIKKNLEDFIRECEKERRDFAAEEEIISNLIAISDKENIIQAKNSNSGTSRSVAVLDPATNMIVKMYTTLKAACQAATFLSKVGYASEFLITDHGVKAMVRKSSKDSSLTLFGYRWLYYNDLVNGHVVFSSVDDPENTNENKTTPVNIDMLQEAETSNENHTPVDQATINAVERIDEINKKKITFPSVAEAYEALKAESKGHFEISTKEAFEDQLNFPEGKTEISAYGYKWRKISITSDKKDQFSPVENDREPHVFSKSQTLSDGVFFKDDGLEPSFSNDVIILKKDRVSGATIKAFQTLKAAFEDWLETRQTLEGKNSEENELKTFKEFYLNGDYNIQGLVWVDLRQSPVQEIFGENEKGQEYKQNEMNIQQNTPLESLPESQIQSSHIVPYQPDSNETKMVLPETIDSSENNLVDVPRNDSLVMASNKDVISDEQQEIHKSSESDSNNHAVGVGDSIPQEIKETETTIQFSKNIDQMQVTDDMTEVGLDIPETKHQEGCDVRESTSNKSIRESTSNCPTPIDDVSKIDTVSGDSYSSSDLQQKTSTKRSLMNDNSNKVLLSMTSVIPKRRKCSNEPTSEEKQESTYKQAAIAANQLMPPPEIEQITEVAVISLCSLKEIQRYESVSSAALAAKLSVTDLSFKIQQRQFIDDYLYIDASEVNQFTRLVEDAINNSSCEMKK